MVVQHNMQAMNANRMLGVTTGLQAKSTEKLSSGYKINRAADDAAGLTISEKMRKQVRGLTQASTNAQDGVSAVQTAEGAMTEVHSMLQRMNELADQAANGTLAKNDREAIQAEIEQLSTEIDRVAETTKFNEIYLLKGDGSKGLKTLEAHDAGLKGKIADNGDGTSTFTSDAIKEGDKVNIGGVEYNIVGESDPSKFTDLNTYTTPASGDQITDANGDTYTYFAQDAKDANDTVVTTAGWYKDGDSTTTAATQTTLVKDGNQLVSNGKATTLVGTSGKTTTIGTLDDIRSALKTASTTAGKTITVKDTAGNTVGSYTTGIKSDGTTTTIEDILKELKEGQHIDDGSNYYYTLPKAGENKNDISVNDAYAKMAEELKAANDIGADADTLSEVKNNGDGTFTITQGKCEVDNSLSFSLHVGADADMTNKINVDIDTMNTAGLGIKGLKVDDETGIAATYAIDAIADAISHVSSQRSALGAVQNRLEHTISNLDNVAENTTSAESRIRDTDMAKEMVEYSKNNILAQAGQSMLAQANQSTQGVLSLLG